MKKIGILLLTLALLCTSLTGCGKDSATVTYTNHELTITLPEEFMDLSDEPFAADLTFVYGWDPIAINGIREEKTTFEAYGLQMDLQRYGDLLIKSNNVRSELTQKNGIWNFSYASGEFTYIVTLWETEDAFWTVQAYCPTEDYNKVKSDIWDILSSITV